MEENKVNYIESSDFANQSIVKINGYWMIDCLDENGKRYRTIVFYYQLLRYNIIEEVQKDTYKVQFTWIEELKGRGVETRKSIAIIDKKIYKYLKKKWLKQKEYYELKDQRDKAEYEAKLRREKRQAEEAAKPVQCPKCGSTQITAVTRKWSPLTGFLTNKVDRVCLKCKYKW